MKSHTYILLIAIVSACTLLAVTSCSEELTVRGVSGPVIRQGPPAHAQAHGYRHKYASDVELVYDSECGVYVVVGFPNHYCYNEHFYRLCGTQWEVSLTLDSGWAPVSEDRLPPGLQKKKVAKANMNPGRLSNRAKK